MRINLENVELDQRGFLQSYFGNIFEIEYYFKLSKENSLYRIEVKDEVGGNQFFLNCDYTSSLEEAQLTLQRFNDNLEELCEFENANF